LGFARGKNGHEVLKEASSFISRGDAQSGSYLSKLRFITLIRPKKPTTEVNTVIGIFFDRICSTYTPFIATDFQSETPDLEPGALTGYKHYLAISHCWDQTPMPDDFDFGVPPARECTLHTSDRIGKNTASALTLHRAIIYAAAYGFKFIWIDQESINQNDPIEKEEAVGQMNLIYRQTFQTTAILNNSIINQDHLDTIGMAGITRGMHEAKISVHSNIGGRTETEANTLKPEKWRGYEV
jgi:hypothetical protein